MNSAFLKRGTIKMIFYKTVRHFFPAFLSWIRVLEDPRQENSTEYRLETMIWVGILLFVLKLESRRQIDLNFNDEKFIKNLFYLNKQKLDRIPHNDSLAYLLKLIDITQLYGLRALMINQLLRNKCLAKYRFDGYYLIAIDGTGFMSFERCHCPYCLTKKIKAKKGRHKVIYYHPVVEAKLVTANGFALSIESEVIKNPQRKVKRQECELKAFYRLAERLAWGYPQLRICLLLDGLYASEKVLDICKKNKWKYIITFKEKSLPETYQEYESLKKQSVENTGEYKYYRDEYQQYWWVNKMNYKFKDRHFINVLECKAFNKKEKEWNRYMWLTNFEIDKNNFYYIANKGGRLRWKEENEGFNIQKNGGYNMEHAYCYDFQAAINFYVLMQIAHILNQLVEKGSLLTADIRKKLGSIKNIAIRLLEDLRNSLFNPNEIETAFAKQFQIRFDTS